MNKSHKLFMGIFVVILFSIGLLTLGCKAVKTQDEISKMLANELQLDKDNNTTVSFIAEYAIGKTSLLWFSFQGQQITNYRAVECYEITNDKYYVKTIYKPMTYAQDIVHVICEAEDIFLINNSSCRSVVYRNKSGDIITQSDISTNELPCVFILRPPINESICDFLDAKGNVIQ